MHVLRTTQIYPFNSLNWVIHRQTHHLGNFTAANQVPEENGSSNATVLPWHLRKVYFVTLKNWVGTQYQKLCPEDVSAFASASTLSRSLQIPLVDDQFVSPDLIAPTSHE